MLLLDERKEIESSNIEFLKYKDNRNALLKALSEEKSLFKKIKSSQ